MNDVAKKPESDLKALFAQVSVLCGLSAAIVEKDFWVCWMLDYLFARSPWKTQLAFKGGTSLSKAYGLIKRFSEDIDLILDWRLLGYDTREPWEDRSNTQQDLFNERANARSAAFLKDVFVPRVKADLETELGRDLDIAMDESARYSRHYYDLWCMIEAGTKDQALKKPDLLDEVVAFKRKFYRCTWARYEQATRKEICLMPPAHALPVLKEDYRHMQNMIFGPKPPFEEILLAIQTLETEIREQTCANDLIAKIDAAH